MAINDKPAPTDKKGVERLLGTINYLGKFIPNLATVTKPIRVLLRKDIEFQWSYEQDKALQEIESILTKDGGPVLRFFDVWKHVTICNAFSVVRCCVTRPVVPCRPLIRDLTKKGLVWGRTFSLRKDISFSGCLLFWLPVY